MGTKLSDAHTGALLTAATPAFIVLFARFVLGETVTKRKLLSLLLATLGIVIVIGWNTGIGAYFWGSVALGGAAVTWACLSVYAKLASTRHDVLTVTTYGTMFALLFTTPLILGSLGRNLIALYDPMIALSVLYLGLVATAGAFFLWNKGLQLMEAGTGSLFFFFQPLVGFDFGMALLT